MKNFLFATIFFIFGVFIFSHHVLAATCGQNITVGQCGALGGCPTGQMCNNAIPSGYACVINGTCPNTSVVCGTGNTVGGCGPSNGCPENQRCNVDLQGYYSCSPGTCTPTPTPTYTTIACGSNSVQTCQNKNVGDSCDTNSLCLPETLVSSPKCLCTYVTPTISPAPTTTITPTPTIEPLPINGEVCANNGTVYPPNSTCYAAVKDANTELMGINLVDSSGSVLSYPLGCSPGPNITYKQPYVTEDSNLNGKSVDKNVTVTTDLVDAQLGFLGPDSNTLATQNPDTIAKTYLFNALFDRPGVDPNAQKESFRTYWRMLTSLSQAQLKAYYLGVSNKESVYYYVGADKKQNKVKIGDLVNSLKREGASCLYQYTDFDHLTDILGIDFWNSCWKNSDYSTQYLALSPTTREQYDQLLPFDFNNMRAYISDGTTVAKENIPYLRAILTGLKGYRSDIITPYFIPGIGFVSIPYTVVPGLVDYYTPSWAVRPLALYPTFGPILADTREDLQQLIILLVSALNNSCSATAVTSPKSSPKTYPNPSALNEQQLTVHATYSLVSKEPDQCVCPSDDSECIEYQWCSGYTYDNCPYYCNGIKGKSTYEINGSATGKPITIFNNPYITSLTDLIMGGKKLITNTSQYSFTQDIIDAINAISDRLISPVQPSFYKMLLPDFASNSATTKTMIGAPTIDNSATPAESDATVTVNGDHTIFRENNLAQDTMQLLQNCWLVPSDQQSSSKCNKSVKPVGECLLSDKPLTGSCSKASFATTASGYATPLSTYIPLVTPELSAVYAEAEKVTGVSCVTLAAIHFMEGGNDPCLSLVSGRKLGVPEPDKGGKVYSTLLETAIDAGYELAAKGGTKNAPAASVIKAMSYYNGNGNANCRIDWTLPNNVSIEPKYSAATGQCPPLFPGEDDPYAVSLLDTKHASMYLRCPIDHDCSFVLPFNRPGAFAVALNYYNSLTQ